MSSSAESIPEGGALALIAHLDAGLSELTRTSWWAVGDAELLRAAIDLETQRRKLEASRLALIAEISARGSAVQTGAKTTAGWLVDKTRLGRGEAQRAVRTAGQLSDLAPSVRAALAAGDIGVGHAVAITQVLGVLRERSIRAGSPVTAQIRAAAEATLLELAGSLDPAQLATAGAVLVDRVDPDWNPFGDDPVLADAARRAFTATPLPDGGVKLGGELDAEAWAMVNAALSPLSAPRPETAEGKDRRSTPRRRADALLELATRALKTGDLPSEGGSVATVFVSTDLPTLQGQLSERAPTFDTGAELTPEQTRRLACDALIIPAVLGSTSAPLDIGRATRVVPSGMRRALIRRDGTCAFPGCTIPAAWADAHHVIWWSNGGPTALSNLVLLCGHHHRLIHHSQWEVEIAADGLPVFTPPAWVSPDIACKDPTWRITLRDRHPRAA